MKKILFTTLFSDDLGLLTRTLPIARELASRGHKIAYCSPAYAPSKLIDEAGFENLPFKHPVFYLDMSGKPNLKSFYRRVKSGQMKQDFGSISSFLAKYIRSLPITFAPSTTEVWNMDHFWALAFSLNENFVRCTCDTLMQVITEYEADVVVDAWNIWACMAARALRKPLVTIVQGDLHPASKGFIWWKEPPTDIPTPVPVVNKVLREYGLQPISNTAELNVGDLTLVIGTPETDPLPEGTDVTYVGPILWEKPNVVLPAWFDALSREKPVVWVYSGNPKYDAAISWADSEVVLQACIRVLAEEDVQVVLSTGHHSLPKSIPSLPNNFRFESFVPGISMAKRSDLLIHHGGYGSCQTGLYTGTPAIIIPTYSERESNARRVAALGAGECIIPAENSSGIRNMLMHEVRARVSHTLRKTRMTDALVKELRKKVKKVLSDPSYIENAKSVSKKMSTYGGPALAARLIDDFIS